MGGVKDVNSKEEVENLVKDGSAVMIHFWASWCDASKHMDQVFSHLSTDFPNAHFLRVEAEEQPEISEAYSVSAVPFFVFIKDGKKVDTLEGAYPAELANKVSKVVGSIHAGEPAAPASLGMAAGPSVLEAIQDLAKVNSSPQGNTHPSPPAGITDLNTRLEKLTRSHPILLFMKGTPEQPKCGFSKKAVEILKSENVKFGTFDILSDNEVREGLKKFSNWPTYPQLYCKGELLGGSDIIIAMHEGGELKQAFADHGVDDDVSKSAVVEPNGQKAGVTDSAGLSSALSSRLESLINSAPVMLFMKGNPDEPRCGFSRKVVDILREEKVNFKTFDILSDEEVRQGLKVYSNWSSYPQLYIKSELIGGSDIVLEMQKSGELQKILIEKGIISLEERLKKLVNSAPVMLFMKGTPDAPECGFSSKVVNALKEEGIKFGSFDIYGDEEVRQGLKTFSNWPTFPQLYYKGELIGGCDIVLDLKSNGELASTLSE
ncbi:monothiol glutaredoxin-S17 [Tanacetum coccineum]|uniref:Monothiol glutaredoxin-S17 n=1 Tax=Tanacetum coccineum TaxID=301880 RepID=A0ABQ4Y806_9ASTR